MLGTRNACSQTSFDAAPYQTRQQDAHHEASVSYLCVITGLTVVHALRPLSSLGEIMGLCFFAVAELAALGMTFASCEGTTTLFLHPRFDSARRAEHARPIKL